MRTAIIFLLLSLLVVGYFYWKGDVFIGSETVDLHVHDTYLVVDHSSLAILLLLPLGTIFFLGGVLGTGFRSRGFWIGLLVFLVADTCLALYVYYLFNS